MKAIGNALICSLNAKIFSRNVDSSCGSFSFGRRERALAMVLLAFAGKVDNFGTVFFNNQLPVSDVIGSEI
jgi:hypothetical protein